MAQFGEPNNAEEWQLAALLKLQSNPLHKGKPKQALRQSKTRGPLTCAEGSSVSVEQVFAPDLNNSQPHKFTTKFLFTRLGKDAMCRLSDTKEINDRPSTSTGVVRGKNPGDKLLDVAAAKAASSSDLFLKKVDNATKPQGREAWEKEGSTAKEPNSRLRVRKRAGAVVFGAVEEDKFANRRDQAASKPAHKHAFTEEFERKFDNPISRMSPTTLARNIQETSQRNLRLSLKVDEMKWNADRYLKRFRELNQEYEENLGLHADNLVHPDLRSKGSELTKNIEEYKIMLSREERYKFTLDLLFERYRNDVKHSQDGIERLHQELYQTTHDVQLLRESRRMALNDKYSAQNAAADYKRLLLHHRDVQSRTFASQRRIHRDIVLENAALENREAQPMADLAKSLLRPEPDDSYQEITHKHLLFLQSQNEENFARLFRVTGKSTAEGVIARFQESAMMRTTWSEQEREAKDRLIQLRDQVNALQEVLTRVKYWELDVDLDEFIAESLYDILGIEDPQFEYAGTAEETIFEEDESQDLGALEPSTSMSGEVTEAEIGVQPERGQSAPSDLSSANSGPEPGKATKERGRTAPSNSAEFREEEQFLPSDGLANDRVHTPDARRSSLSRLPGLEEEGAVESEVPQGQRMAPFDVSESPLVPYSPSPLVTDVPARLKTPDQRLGTPWTGTMVHEGDAFGTDWTQDNDIFASPPSSEIASPESSFARAVALAVDKNEFTDESSGMVERAPPAGTDDVAFGAFNDDSKDSLGFRPPSSDELHRPDTAATGVSSRPLTADTTAKLPETTSRPDTADVASRLGTAGIPDAGSVDTALPSSSGTRGPLEGNTESASVGHANASSAEAVKEDAQRGSALERSSSRSSLTRSGSKRLRGGRSFRPEASMRLKRKDTFQRPVDSLSKALMAEKLRSETLETKQDQWERTLATIRLFFDTLCRQLEVVPMPGDPVFGIDPNTKKRSRNPTHFLASSISPRTALRMASVPVARHTSAPSPRLTGVPTSSPRLKPLSSSRSLNANAAASRKDTQSPPPGQLTPARPSSPALAVSPLTISRPLPSPVSSSPTAGGPDSPVLIKPASAIVIPSTGPFAGLTPPVITETVELPPRRADDSELRLTRLSLADLIQECEDRMLTALMVTEGLQAQHREEQLRKFRAGEDEVDVQQAKKNATLLREAQAQAQSDTGRRRHSYQSILATGSSFLTSRRFPNNRISVSRSWNIERYSKDKWGEKPEQVAPREQTLRTLEKLPDDGDDDDEPLPTRAMLKTKAHKEVGRAKKGLVKEGQTRDAHHREGAQAPRDAIGNHEAAKSLYGSSLRAINRRVSK